MLVCGLFGCSCYGASGSDLHLKSAQSFWIGYYISVPSQKKKLLITVGLQLYLV